MSASRRVRARMAGIRKQTSLGSLHAGCLGKRGFSGLQLELRARVGATCRLASPQAVDSAAEQRVPSSRSFSHPGLHWEVQPVWGTREPVRGDGGGRVPIFPGRTSPWGLRDARAPSPTLCLSLPLDFSGPHLPLAWRTRSWWWCLEPQVSETPKGGAGPFTQDSLGVRPAPPPRAGGAPPSAGLPGSFHPAGLSDSPQVPRGAQWPGRSWKMGHLGSEW